MQGIIRPVNHPLPAEKIACFTHLRARAFSSKGELPEQIKRILSALIGAGQGAAAAITNLTERKEKPQ